MTLVVNPMQGTATPSQVVVAVTSTGDDITDELLKVATITDDNAATARELLTSINDRLGALILLLSPAYSPNDEPTSFIAAAQDLRLNQ